MAVVLQYPDTIKRRFGRRIGQPTGISRQPLRPPPRCGIPLRQNGRRHRDTAVPFRRRPPVPVPSDDADALRPHPDEPAETTPQTAKKRPQGENYKFATKSPPTFVPQTKDKRDETNPDSTLPAAPHGPLRTGRPPSRYLSGRLRFRIRMPKILKSAIFSLLSQDYR